MSPAALRSVLRLVGACLALVALAAVAGEPPAPQPSPEERAAAERRVLRDLCRYLRLSRSQVNVLLTSARTADRARAAHAEAQEEGRRRLEALRGVPERQAEATALEKALAEHDARFRVEIARFAAPQMARLFTREQVALAWALLGGKPPTYAAASDALRRPDAGFARPAGRLILSLLDTTDGVVLLESGRVLRGMPGRSKDGVVQFDLEVPVGGVVRSDALLHEGVTRPTAPERPFPQVVVETNDLRDLLDPVERLAVRVYRSAEWLPALAEAAREGVGARASRDHRLVPRRPVRTVREYRFERGLRDLTGRGPAVEALGGALGHGQYHFAAGQGLRIPDVGVRDDYEIEFTFRSDGSGEYRKLLDFKNGKADGGLYLHGGGVTFYTLAVGGAVEPGREHRLRLERNRETRIVRAYLDLRPLFAFIDLNDDAVFDQGSALFFADDVTTGNEQGAGAVRWISIRTPVTAP